LKTFHGEVDEDLESLQKLDLNESLANSESKSLKNRLGVLRVILLKVQLKKKKKKKKKKS
jgi:hypothetical protein